MKPLEVEEELGSHAWTTTLNAKFIGHLIEDMVKMRDKAVVQECHIEATSLKYAVEALKHYRTQLAKDDGEQTELHLALEQSLKLQSHYAKLLNMHDGGKRRGFASVDAWLNQFRKLKTKKLNGNQNLKAR